MATTFEVRLSTPRPTACATGEALPPARMIALVKTVNAAAEPRQISP